MFIWQSDTLFVCTLFWFLRFLRPVTIPRHFIDRFKSFYRRESRILTKSVCLKKRNNMPFILTILHNFGEIINDCCCFMTFSVRAVIIIIDHFYFRWRENCKTFSQQISRENFCQSLWKVKRSLTAGDFCEFWWCDEITLNFTQEVCEQNSDPHREISLFPNQYNYIYLIWQIEG